MRFVAINDEPDDGPDDVGREEPEQHVAHPQPAQGHAQDQGEPDVAEAQDSGADEVQCEEHDEPRHRADDRNGVVVPMPGGRPRPSTGAPRREPSRGRRSSWGAATARCRCTTAPGDPRRGRGRPEGPTGVRTGPRCRRRVRRTAAPPVDSAAISAPGNPGTALAAPTRTRPGCCPAREWACRRWGRPNVGTRSTRLEAPGRSPR